MSIPNVPLDRGIHVVHLFYRLNRAVWQGLPAAASAQAREQLQALATEWAAASNPRLTAYATIGNKADLAFLLQHKTLDGVGAMRCAVETAFPPGALEPVYSYLSVTELTEYMPTEEEARERLLHQEKLAADSEEFNRRLAEEKRRLEDYSHYRLYPELPDWEVMAFYPMNKRRTGVDNWYMLDFATRRKLMGSHARTGRKYAGKVVQMITGSTGLDDWEWGVTLVARQVDVIKQIVYEMRFDEVSARYADFGPFYINLRLAVPDLWTFLRL